MSMKKDEIIAFMSKHDIKIPNPIPAKSVLLGKIRKKILKNCMSLILWLKKLAILFYDCPISLRIECHRNGMESM